MQTEWVSHPGHADDHVLNNLLSPAAPGRLPAIDGLRAVAMTMVIAQHCSLLPFGWVGVWLFYVISGFVICRTLAADPPGPFGARYRAFMGRRFFRIVPIYLVYILLNVVVMVATGRLGSLRDIPFLLTFSYNWQMIWQLWPIESAYAAFGHLWTLSVEEQFYLFFPLLLLLLPRRLFVAVALVLVLAGPLVRALWSSFVSGLPGAQDPNWAAYAVYAASFTQFDAFLSGALLAMAEPHVRRSRAAARLPVVALLVAVIYVLIYVFLNHAHGATGVNLLRNIFSGTLTGQHREVFVYTVVDLLAAGALVHVMRGGRGTALFAAPALSLVGRISYGGYLFHALVLLLLGLLTGVDVSLLPVPARLVGFAVVWLIVVAVAYVSFRWFENRVVAWSRGNRGVRQPMARAPLTSPLA